MATPDTSVGDLSATSTPSKWRKGEPSETRKRSTSVWFPAPTGASSSSTSSPTSPSESKSALLNVLEERDIQIRGYQLRLPSDLLLVASANPEDYTNRGRIITPLKDRFGAEVSTHYPIDLDDELARLTQECQPQAAVPTFLLEVLARFTRAVRDSPSVDERSGVSARFGIAAAESVAAAAARRAAIVDESPAVARICDLAGVVPTLRGKVEFDVSEEGRELDVLHHLLRRATAESFRARLSRSWTSSHLLPGSTMASPSTLAN